MFGVYFFAGSFVGFIALLSVVAVAMRRAGLLDTVISVEHLHDIGKFLFAFTVFWTYIAFSQFFLIVREPSGGDDLVQGADGRVLDDGLDLPHGGTFRGAVLLPDGARRQAEGATLAVGERGSSPCTSWISTGRSCRRSIPRDPSVGSGRGRVRRRRRVLRGGGGWLMRRQALARYATRGSPNRSRSRTSRLVLPAWRV